MFEATLSLTAAKEKQVSCPPAWERTNERDMRCLRIRRNRARTQAAVRANPDNVKRSERSQTREAACSVIPPLGNVQRGRALELGRRLGVARGGEGLRGGEGQLTGSGYPRGVMR